MSLTGTNVNKNVLALSVLVRLKVDERLDLKSSVSRPGEQKKKASIARKETQFGQSPAIQWTVLQDMVQNMSSPIPISMAWSCELACSRFGQTF